MNTPLSPTVTFQNRVTNLFNQQVQRLFASGQILDPLRQFLISEYNANMPKLVKMIFDHFVYGGTVQEATDAMIQPHLNNLIHQMMNNYQMLSQRQMMYAPSQMVGYPQPPRFYTPQPNQAFINGGIGNQAYTGFTQSTGIMSEPVTPLVCDAVSSTSSTQGAVQTAVQTETKSYMEQPKMQAHAEYHSPILMDPVNPSHSSVKVDNGWEKGTIISYKDVDTKLEISYASMQLYRGMRSPLSAIETVLRSLKGCLSKDQYVAVSYTQLKPYELDRGEFQTAIEALKEVSLPHNAKYTYLKNIRKVLGAFNTSTYETVESFLITEFNTAALHGALFTSDWDPSVLTFSVRTLRELIGYLDPEDSDDLPDHLKQIPGFKDRLAQVARDTIGNALVNMELSDPNTPEGLEDYITIVGDVAIDDYHVSDIKLLKERSMRTNKDGEKTSEAKAAEEVYTKIFSELMKYSVVRINRVAIYTNLMIPGMLVDYANKRVGDLPYVNRRSQCIAGPGEPDNHVEFFTYRTVDELSTNFFHIYFRIVPSVLMAYTGTKTSDEWYYLLPTVITL